MAQKTIIIFLFFAFCAAFAVVFAFARPVYDPDNICQHSARYFLNSNAGRMRAVFGVSPHEFSATQNFFQWFPEYRLNCDSTSFLFLARDWPQSYYERNIYIDHPLYNFFAFLFIEPIRFFMGEVSYPVIFGVFIFVNYLLLTASAFLLYFFIARLFSPLIGFLSSIFLLFSPFVHSMVDQTTSAGVMELFVVSAGLWLVWQYSVAPSYSKLILYSFLFGILLLGKQVVALSFFVLFVAFYFKRYREGLIFLIAHAAPTLLWYLYVVVYLRLPYYVINISVHNQGVWLLQDESWRWYTMGGVILSALPYFFSNLIYGFLLIPVLFAAYGVYAWIRAHADQIVFLAVSLTGSFLLLFFIMNLYRPSLSFLLFPVVYPAAAFGIIRLREQIGHFHTTLSQLFFVSAVALILYTAQFNFYHFMIPGVS